MGAALQLGRLAFGALGVAAFGKGLDFSTDGASHQSMTYLGFYGLAVVFAVITGVIWVVIEQRKKGEGARSATVTKSPGGTAAQHSGAGHVIQHSTVTISGKQSDEGSERLARRAARHVIGELEASRKTVQTALTRGHFWYVVVEGLQFEEWRNAKDLLADFAPTAYDATSNAYVHVERLNAAANNAYMSDTEEFRDDDDRRAMLNEFLTDSAKALRKLRSYVA